jgi:hypothetical protein
MGRRMRRRLRWRVLRDEGWKISTLVEVRGVGVVILLCIITVCARRFADAILLMHGEGSLSWERGSKEGNA